MDNFYNTFQFNRLIFESTSYNTDLTDSQWFLQEIQTVGILGDSDLCRWECPLVVKDDVVYGLLLTARTKRNICKIHDRSLCSKQS